MAGSVAGWVMAMAPAAAQAQQTPAGTPPATTAAPPSRTPAETAAAAAGAPAQVPARPVAGGTRAQARQAAAAAAVDDEEPDVIVTGQRNLPGAVIGDIPPDQQLGPADIRSYGVSSVSDLLDELAPQIRSDRGSGGAPVVLLNGKRISGFQEVRDLPTEAIARVDILPEEVALKYGYAADQRVVNIVLRRRFRAATVELAGSVPTEGGRSTETGNVDLLSIRGQGRFNVHVTYTDSSQLTEAARDIIQTPSLYSLPGNVVLANPLTATTTVYGVPTAAANGAATLAQFAATPQSMTDMGQYRTLLPATNQLNANIIYATSILGNVGATFNAELQTNDSTSLNGLPTATFALPVGNPYSPFAATTTVDRAFTGMGVLTQNSSSWSGHLGGTFNGNIGQWRWSLISNFDRSHSETFTDLGLDAAAFQARLTANDPTANPFGPLSPGDLPSLNGSIARSTSTSGGADALFNGTLLDLPAGSISTSVRAGITSSDLSSTAYRRDVTNRADVFSAADITRTTESGQLNVDVPLTSRAKDVLRWAGTISLNGNVAVRHLSDFGVQTTRGYGVNWTVRDGVRILASATDQGDAPSAAQLGNPVIVTPNVRVFDYVLGTTATVTTVSGGNPALAADSRHTRKVELNLKPFKARDLTFVANYIATHTDNAIASFPTPTAQINAAFPDRFTRDASGNLTRLDTRPINFARTESSELRYGFNLSIALKSKLQKQFEAFRAGKGPNPLTPAQQEALRAQFQRQRQANGQRGGDGPPPPPPSGDGAPPPPTGDGATPQTGSASTTGGQPAVGATGTGQPGGGGGFGGFGGGGGRGFGGPGGGGRGFGGGGFGGRGGAQGGGRLQFALYHTWHFTDRVLISPTGPALDLLNGDAIGQSGGQSRHELEGQAGYLNNGLGVRMSLNYQSGTTVNGGFTGSTTTLNFSSLTTVALRLFADPSSRLDLIAKHPWLRGARATLSFDNLFNSRQRVTDQTGATPISYQPDYLNPLGRTVRLSIRKLFY